MIVTYPWMPKELNPNARVHWRVKNDKFQQYKMACWALTMKAKLPKCKSDRALLQIQFFKPNRARRDLDNCLAAFKAGLDGIAQAINVDDSRFMFTLDMADEIGGYVKVNFNYKGIDK